MSTPKREIKKLEFLFTKEQLQQFIEKLVDLSAIDDSIVIKIDKQNFLMYCVSSDVEDRNNRTILAFKSFTFESNSIISMVTELETQVIYIMKDAKKTVSNLKNYLDFDDAIDCVITYDVLNDLNFGDMIKFKSKKLKLNFNGGSPKDSNIKISLKSIKDKSTPEMFEFKFNMTKGDFDKARRMSQIEKENDVIYFTIQSGELNVAENRWALKLQDLEYKNKDGVETDINVCIPKRYFKTATCDENGLDVEVYKTHVILNNAKSSLMISRQMSLR